LSNLNLRNKEINKALTIKLDVIPDKIPEFQEHIRRAPKRESKLTNADIKLALKNALRYIPEEYHEKLAPEFLDELLTYGRIYGYRFRPEGKIYGKPIDEYKGKCVEGKAFQVMIDNNLDFDVALYPYELVTYGETGQVFQNWMQYQLTKKYLEVLTEDQTLVLHSGHPVGLFKSIACTDAKISIAKTFLALSNISLACLDAIVPIETWSSWFAEDGIESTLAG